MVYNQQGVRSPGRFCRSDFVCRSCSACKERVDEFATSCHVCTDAEVVTKYKLKGSIADAAGTVECVILAEGTDVILACVTQ